MSVSKLAGLLLFPMYALAQTPPASVNGEPIDSSVFEHYANARAEALGTRSDDAARRGLLDELVLQALLAQDALEKSLHTDPTVAAELELARRGILASAAINAHLATLEPSDADLTGLYETLTRQYDGTQYRVRAIVVDDRHRAEQLGRRLAVGEPFIELAREYSTDPSAAEGGDLGWVTPEMLEPALADVLRNLSPGDIQTQPLQTDYGWQLIALEATRPEPAPSLASVRPQLVQRWQGMMINRYLESLRANAKIEINLPD